MSSPVTGLSAEQVRLINRLRPGEPGDRGPLLGPRPRSGQPVPLSYGQEQIWLVDRLLGTAVVSSAPLFMRLRGGVDPEAMRGAVAALVERHEVLRTTVAIVDGEPVQQIHDPSFLDFAVEDLTGRDPQQCVEHALAEQAAGFEIGRAPLLRTRLYVRSADEAYLMFVRHHLIFDASSDALFLAELSALYQAALCGPPAASPGPAIQYADYAIWQREYLTGERLDRLVAFWRERLSDPPAPFELAGSRPRPASRSTHGQFLSVPLTAEQADGVRALARARRLTPFMLLVAVLRIVLWQHSGEQDVLIGTPMSGRTRPETEGLLGFLLNMVILRNPVEAGITVSQLLDRERDAVLAAYDHQDLPFGVLSRELGPLMRPLRVVIAYDAQEAVSPALSGLDVREIDLGLATSQHDLEIRVVADRTGTTVQWAYDEQVLDGTVVRRLAAAYQAVLAEVIARPDRRLAEIPASIAPDRVVPDGVAPDRRAGVDGEDSAEPAPRPPAGPIEERIAEEWRALDLDARGAHDNLFALGGHSLTVAKLAFQLEVVFGLPVATGDLLVNATIASQAALIDRLLRDRLASADPAAIDRMFRDLENR